MHVYIYPTAIGNEIRSAGGGGGGTLTGTVLRRQTRGEAAAKGADTGDFWGKQPAMCAGEPVSEGDFAVVFWARWEEPCPEIHLPSQSRAAPATDWPRIFLPQLGSRL